jgi:hypothetical protein
MEAWRYEFIFLCSSSKINFISLCVSHAYMINATLSLPMLLPLLLTSLVKTSLKSCLTTCKLMDLFFDWELFQVYLYMCFVDLDLKCPISLLRHIKTVYCFNAKDHVRSRGTEWQQHKEKHNKIAFTKQRKRGITI